MLGRSIENHFFSEKSLPIEKQKSFYRNFYKKRIQALTLSDRKRKSDGILKLLYRLPLFSEAGFIAGYKAFKEEPSLESFYKSISDKLCYPVIEGKRLGFYKRSKLWSKNCFSILEPDPKKENKIDLNKISVFLIPGLAFDRRGGRLGRGKAYYDTTLSELNPISGAIQKQIKNLALFVGVAFVEQIQNEPLPLSKHDVPVDILLTDKFVLIPSLDSKFKKYKKRKKL